MALIVLTVLGWRIIGITPNEPKMVVVAGPHTANMDGFLLVMTAWYLRVKLQWMVKAEILRPPLGWLVRWGGGVPIDRSSRHNTVAQAVQAFAERDKFVLVVAPEGTRSRSDHWKTGFYWIAHEAQVPLYMARMDYGRKVVEIKDGLLHTTGDIEADMERIWDVYRPIVARFPEKVSEMRLRDDARRE